MGTPRIDRDSDPTDPTSKPRQSLTNSQQSFIIYVPIPQVFEFLKRKDFVVDLLKHIGTSAISDLVLRLITCVDGTDIKQAWMDPSVELSSDLVRISSDLALISGQICQIP